MKVQPISSVSYFRYKAPVTDFKSGREVFSGVQFTGLTGVAPNYFNISFGSNHKKDFELNYSMRELRNLVSDEAFTPFRMLDENAISYKSLSKNDKIVLAYLVEASVILDDVYKKQDNPYNMAFEAYLKEEIKSNNIRAWQTKRIYDAQKGIFATNVTGEEIKLAKGLEQPITRGFYPPDLRVGEFHNILITMLENGEDEEVKNILNQRSIVVRDGDKLKAIDYTEYFKPEFTRAADALDNAAKYCNSGDFKDYLILQAKALRENNPWLDCDADKLWATLQDTTLEFTISRECYDDRFTTTVMTHPKLKKMLQERGINPYAKDSIGVRVGIVDKEGTNYLLRIKEYLPFMAAKMPYSDFYSQALTKKSGGMVDVDIVNVTGQNGAFRGGIALASNLPNADKLAVQTGGARRCVYHKQIRDAKYINGVDDKLNHLLNESQHKYFSTKALHDFVILHENLHSLGPKEGLDALGIHKTIIEENKADMGAIVMLEELKAEGFFTDEEQNAIITSWLLAYVPSGARFDDAHAKRAIMQYNYLIQKGAIEFDSEGKMLIDFAGVTRAARQMLCKIVVIQMNKDAGIAKEYIDKWAVWSKELKALASKLGTVDKRLNSYLEVPLAKKLLKTIK